MTMEKLKPCPLCGGEAVLVEKYGREYVYCRNFDCEISGPDHAVNVRAWNTRPIEGSLGLRMNKIKAELVQARTAAEKLARALVKGPCVGCPLFDTDCFARCKSRDDGEKCREEILEWAYLFTASERVQP